MATKKNTKRKRVKTKKQKGGSLQIETLPTSLRDLIVNNKIEAIRKITEALKGGSNKLIIHEPLAQGEGEKIYNGWYGTPGNVSKKVVNRKIKDDMYGLKDSGIRITVIKFMESDTKIISTFVLRYMERNRLIYIRNTEEFQYLGFTNIEALARHLGFLNYSYNKLNNLKTAHYDVTEGEIRRKRNQRAYKIYS